jgi:hypothetical protein
VLESVGPHLLDEPHADHTPHRRPFQLNVHGGKLASIVAW